MKLVEILAREFGEWPLGSAAIVQDDDRTLAGNKNKDFLEFCSGSWGDADARWGWIFEKYEIDLLATAHATAIVTREMWEAERERIKRDMYSGSITTKPQWRGPQDGLPTAGTRVMFRNHECEVVGYHDGMVVCAMDDDYENGCYDGFLARDLRPIPTDREKWIEAAMNYWDHEMPRVSLEHIYDAGLAKLPG